MHCVAAGLGDYIDGCAGRRSEVRAVVAAIDLEFLHIVLADGQAHATTIARGFAPVHGYAISPAIAAVERKSALRRLLDSEILVSGQASRIGDAGR